MMAELTDTFNSTELTSQMAAEKLAQLSGSILSDANVKNLYYADLNHSYNQFIKAVSSPENIEALASKNVGVFAYEFPESLQPFVDKLADGQIDKKQFIDFQKAMGAIPFHQSKEDAEERLNLEADMIVNFSKHGIKILGVDNSVGAAEYQKLQQDAAIGWRVMGTMREQLGYQAVMDLMENKASFKERFREFFNEDAEVQERTAEIIEKRKQKDIELGEHLSAIAGDKRVAMFYGGGHLKGIKEGLSGQTISVAGVASISAEISTQNPLIDYTFDYDTGTVQKTPTCPAPAPNAAPKCAAP